MLGHEPLLHTPEHKLWELLFTNFSTDQSEYEFDQLMILIIITSIVSFFLAGYHVGIEYGLINELSSCKTEVSKNISKDILLKELQSKLAPSCKEVAFKLFGLSLASINMIMSLILTILYYKIFLWTKRTNR